MVHVLPPPEAASQVPGSSYLYALATRFGGGMDDDLVVAYFLPDSGEAQQALESLCGKRDSGLPLSWERRQGDYQQRAAHYQSAASQVGLRGSPLFFEFENGRGIKLYIEVASPGVLRQVSGRETASLTHRNLFGLQVQAVQSLESYVLPAATVAKSA